MVVSVRFLGLGEKRTIALLWASVVCILFAGCIAPLTWTDLSEQVTEHALSVYRIRQHKNVMQAC